MPTEQDTAEAGWLTAWREGPTRLRWTALPPQLGDAAPDFALQDASGALVRSADLRRDGPALLLFWRHYGCGCGMDRATRLATEHAQYTAAGARVVVIGQASPERSKAYGEKYAIPCPILCDPTRATYERYGLLDGTPAQIVFDAPDEFLRRDYDAGAKLAVARREAGRPLVDSPWQLPGEFVIDRAGVIQLAYRYQYCEDFPDPRVLIAAIRAAG